MITPHEILCRVCSGNLVLVGEVRAATVKEVGFLDAKSGIASTVLLMTYFVELMRDSFEIVKITRRVGAPEGQADHPQTGVEKGKCYAFEIESVEKKPGFILARLGPIEPQEVDLREAASGAPPGAPDAVSLTLSNDEQLQGQP